MKKYSCKKAHQGKVAYRTPSRFRYEKCQANKKAKTTQAIAKPKKNMPTGENSPAGIFFLGWVLCVRR